MRRAILLLSVTLSWACSSAEAPPGPAASPAPRGFDAALGRLFVTNESGGDISVVDVGAQRTVSRRFRSASVRAASVSAPTARCSTWP